MTLFQGVLQTTPTVLDIESHKEEISLMNEFGPSFESLLRALIFVAALAAFGYMVWGAVDWIMSQGDSGKVESARKKITHAMIGLALLAAMVVIFSFVQYALGMDMLFNLHPTPAALPPVLPGRQVPTFD